MLQERYEKVIWMTSPVYRVFKSKTLKVILDYLDSKDIYNFRKAIPSAVWFTFKEKADYQALLLRESQEEEFQARKSVYANGTTRIGRLMINH